MTINGRVTTRRRGRPRAINPLVDRRMANFSEAEGRQLNRWMRERGIKADGEALRLIVLERMAADRITDPGPDSQLGLPPESLRRKNSQTSKNTRGESDQLALTA